VHKAAIIFGGSGGIGRVVADFFVSAGYGVTIAANLNGVFHDRGRDPTGKSGGNMPLFGGAAAEMPFGTADSR
jgi:NAD(P)-dependent dehydrogenase (short-subunit alcohol dehydrogenase family)